MTGEKKRSLRYTKKTEDARIMKSYGLKGSSSPSECMQIDMRQDDRFALGLHLHSAERVALAEGVVRHQIQDTVEWALAQGYPISENFVCVVRFDWSLRRKLSWGGKYSGAHRSYGSTGDRISGPMISVSMGVYVPLSATDTQFTFSEYRFMRNNPWTADFTGTWEECLRVLTIHEVCHAIQFNGKWSKKNSSYYYTPADRRAHGPLWKDLYSSAREAFGFISKDLPVE